ncbi:hypothetical protein AYO21_02706 [Fonsecaea monophora]|uniref:Uncharacterized protein n=1 Tax=Fonsecaea monophora TaxID=254056 RepID=A0A177FFY2_9EURO|nr:hypothetical protein AYO21_02706 [Fonsecaea monophora]KAH0836065.1 hypothetical protein FOPE_04435 [Fonsecaea pedrosoi]OAG43087.1 hypothetical protein AYO21_02706 [Fonsecaea monophora]
MAPTALTPRVDVPSDGSACEQFGCTFARLVLAALSWLAKGAGKVLSWLWHASGAAYLFDLVLEALKIVAISVAAVIIVPWTLLIAIRIILWVAKECRKRIRKPLWSKPTPRRLFEEPRHFHPFPAASSSSRGSASSRTPLYSNYGTCADSAGRAPPPQAPPPRPTNIDQQFVPPAKESSVTFQKWYRHTQTCLADKPNLQEFPFPPIASCTKCKDKAVQGRPCHHAIAEFFQQSPKYSRQWLRRERKRWHPDKFSQCSRTISQSAEDVFKIVQELYQLHPPI